MGYARSGKYKGIHKRKSDGNFIARFTLEDGGQVFVGSFKSLRQARLRRFRHIVEYYQDQIALVMTEPEPKTKARK